jgi:hypothetical protein
MVAIACHNCTLVRFPTHMRAFALPPWCFVEAMVGPSRSLGKSR